MDIKTDEDYEDDELWNLVKFRWEPLWFWAWEDWLHEYNQ